MRFALILYLGHYPNVSRWAIVSMSTMVLYLSLPTLDCEARGVVACLLIVFIFFNLRSTLPKSRCAKRGKVLRGSFAARKTASVSGPKDK